MPGIQIKSQGLPCLCSKSTQNNLKLLGKDQVGCFEREAWIDVPGLSVILKTLGLSLVRKGHYLQESTPVADRGL